MNFPLKVNASNKWSEAKHRSIKSVLKTTHIPNDNPVGCLHCIKIRKHSFYLLWHFPHRCLIGWEWPPTVFQNVHRTLWAELMSHAFSPKAYSATLTQNIWGRSGEAAVEKRPKEKRSSFRTCQCTNKMILMCSVDEAGMDLPLNLPSFNFRAPGLCGPLIRPCT